ncbi:MAG: hypothetical protein ABJN95_20095 [Maribacter sp.]|uniref:hypothetical protein n=1 Tax=Maribacter sp. TaxID=1897614 RepID=UPI003297659B
MNLKKLIAIVVMGLVTLSACGEKKTKNMEIDTSAVEEAAVQIEEEAAANEAKIKAAKKRVADSLKKVDSLRQVKEHGHVH